MKNSDKRKLKNELKADGKKQLEKLMRIVKEAEGKTAEELAREEAERPCAYAMELKLSVAPPRHPAAEVFTATGDKPQPMWMTQAALMKKLGIAAEDSIYGVAFDNVICLYKPEPIPRSKDPVDASWPSLLNTREIAELCTEEVKRAGELTAHAVETPPMIFDTETGTFKTASLPSELKAVYQVGTILYLSFKEHDGLEGDPERERLLWYHDGIVENLVRRDATLYRTVGGEYTSEKFCLCDEAAGVPAQVPVMEYAELLKRNEPYRIAHIYSSFKRFEVKSETEWLDLLMQVKKESEE